MKNKINKPVLISLLVGALFSTLLFWGFKTPKKILLTPSVGYISTNYTLTNGQELKFEPIIEENSNLLNFKIEDKYYDRLSNYQPIQDLEEPKIQFTKFLQAVNESITCDSKGYYDILELRFSNCFHYIPENEPGEQDELYKLDSAMQFFIFKKLFKSKLIRKKLFEEALDYLSNTCNSYPKDYRKEVILVLNDLEAFVKTLNTTNYSDDQVSEFSYIKGFVYRRFLNEDVPSEELLDYVQKTKAKITEIQPSTLPESFIEVIINNQIKVRYLRNEIKINSIISDKNVNLNPQNTEIETVSFKKENNEGRYIFIGNIDGEKFERKFDKELIELE